MFFDFLRLLNIDDEVVEDVLARGLLHKGDTELVDTCFQRQKVELILLVGLAGDVKDRCTPNEQRLVCGAFDLP